MTKIIESKGSPTEWVIDRALRGLIGAALRIPYNTRVPFMGTALRSCIGPLAGYTKRAEANIALIYPNMPANERKLTAAKVCDNFGRTLIENYSWSEFSNRLASTVPMGDGLEVIAQAKADGRPVIFVTGHFGNHEAPRHVLTGMGYDIGGLYRPMTNSYFNKHYATTMTAWGGPVFEQGRRGTLGFARHLRNGGMGTLLFDVANSKGVPITFMGKKANTTTSAADLAIKLDALVVPYFGTRCTDGLTFEVEIQSQIQRGTPEQMMQDMTDRLTEKVMKHPNQWFWVHRRWKNAP